MIGKPMERLDIRPKVMGEMKFGIDLKMDGMLFAAVKLNPNKGQPHEVVRREQGAVDAGGQEDPRNQEWRRGRSRPTAGTR